MITNNATVNFSSGQLAPTVWGRIDRPFYATGVEVMRNFIPLLTGPAFFRPGTTYVNHTRLNRQAFLIPFQFNDAQAYVLEFTDLKMRVYKDGGVVTETAKNVTGATQASQVVVTSNSHGFNDGDEVYFLAVGGMTELNGNFYIVSDSAANTFKLKDIDGNYISSSGFGAYTSGGTVARVYEITTPYVEADLFELKYAQTADVMYIVHPMYAPRKLTRTAHASWTLTTYTRTNDKFIAAAKNITGITQANPGVVTSVAHGYDTGDRVLIESVGGMTQLNGNSYYAVKITDDTYSLTTLAGVAVNTSSYGAYTTGGTSKLEKYPGAVGFYGGRLFMGGSDGDPDTLFGSRGPNTTTGAPQYDDFTVGTAASDAVVFTITSQNGTADRIRWFSGNPKFMVIGTFGGVYKANGGSDGAAITPTAISVSNIESYGCQDINPVFVGSQTVYVEKGGRTIRSFEFDLLSDTYSAFDKNVLSEDITYGGLTQIAFTQGRPDLIWGARGDGRLVSCTFLSREDVAGWAHHPIGGDGLVRSVCPEFRPNNFDRLWVVVERTINGHTRRYMEYLTDDPTIPDRSEYYTGDSAADLTKYRNLTFEEQKKFVRLDSALALDTTQTTTLSLSAASGDSVTATAGSSIFSAASVGKYIFIKYIDGDETGVAKITAYTSGTQVTVKVLQTFDSTSIASGGWYLLATTVSGLGHLEGEEVGVLTDGGVHPNKTVTNGQITLDYAARYVIVGEPYTGFIRTLDLEFGAQAGVAQGRPRNIHKIIMKFRNTLGGSYGSNVDELYGVEQINYRRTNEDYTDRPPLIFNGTKELSNFDSWDTAKRVFLLQDQPLPMTVLSLVPFMDISSE